MDITDLMIGDWVQVPSLIDNVEHYDAWCKVKQLRDYDLDVVGFKGLKYDEIAPIPLTPEILEKNFGEKRAKGGFFYHFMGKELRGCEYILEYHKDNRFAFCREHGGLLCYISSVHELQHALKLCRIKKEIIL